MGRVMLPGTEVKASKKTAEPLEELGGCLGAVADGELYFVTSTRMFSYSPGGTSLGSRVYFVTSTRMFSYIPGGTSLGLRV